MKFFTLDLYQSLFEGEVDNWDQFHSTVACYQDHLNKIRHQLPESVLEFAGQSMIADALLARVRFDREKGEMELTLRCGDLQSEYFDLISRHSNAEISPEDEFALATIARGTISSNRFWYDGFCQEVDVTDDGRIEHRFLFHPGLSFTIRCSSLEWKCVPRAGRELPRLKDRFPGGPPTPPHSLSR